jgi:hypothetical protein
MSAITATAHRFGRRRRRRIRRGARRRSESRRLRWNFHLLDGQWRRRRVDRFDRRQPGQHWIHERQSGEHRIDERFHRLLGRIFRHDHLGRQPRRSRRLDGRFDRQHGKYWQPGEHRKSNPGQHQRVGRLRFGQCGKPRECGKLDGKHGWLDGQHRRLDGQHGRLDGQHGRLDGKHGWLDGKHGWLDGKHGWLDGKHGRIDGRLDGKHRRIHRWILGRKPGLWQRRRRFTQWRTGKHWLVR